MSAWQPSLSTTRQPAEKVWVLTGTCGAVGGIERFFQALEAAPACAFIIALYASSKTASLAARLFAKTTLYAVYASGIERTLYSRDVLVIPLDGTVDRTMAGVDDARDRASIRIPCLDQVLLGVAGRYREQAGVIVFSGIAPQGADGCQAIRRLGGKVGRRITKALRTARCRVTSARLAMSISAVHLNRLLRA
ncbi:MAG: hypothetical protein LBV36_04425 [Chromatiales bacterium]|jgi:chemosensory pili system protein ChpB (putative protein-glutamate methylesterase)|nr:hypothetical protein [Chromatiales bacterium]